MSIDNHSLGKPVLSRLQTAGKNALKGFGVFKHTVVKMAYLLFLVLKINALEKKANQT